uniref:Putative secreted peptide n=1 Tax=Anopheles braziliensis TaxID=58242 RepID=A0A2M3ZTT3_9DIPT
MPCAWLCAGSVSEFSSSSCFASVYCTSEQPSSAKWYFRLCSDFLSSIFHFLRVVGGPGLLTMGGRFAQLAIIVEDR